MTSRVKENVSRACDTPDLSTASGCLAGCFERQTSGVKTEQIPQLLDS
jgi:hypothetical protein